MRTNLTTDNLRFVFKNTPMFDKINNMVVDRKYDELEEILRIEWLAAQDRAVILNKMYAEIVNKNIRENLEDYEDA